MFYFSLDCCIDDFSLTEFLKSDFIQRYFVVITHHCADFVVSDTEIHSIDDNSIDEYRKWTSLDSNTSNLTHWFLNTDLNIICSGHNFD